MTTNDERAIADTCRAGGDARTKLREAFCRWVPDLVMLQLQRVPERLLPQCLHDEFTAGYLFGLVTAWCDLSGLDSHARIELRLDRLLYTAIYAADGDGPFARASSGIERRNPRVLAGAAHGYRDLRSWLRGETPGRRLQQEFSLPDGAPPADWLPMLRGRAEAPTQPR